MTNQAIKPDFIIKNMPSLKADTEAAKKGASEEERQLFNMAQSAGWKVFGEHLNNALAELDQINDIAIEQGLGFDQIGQNTVIISSTKSIIKRLLNKVTDAVDACQSENE